MRCALHAPFYAKTRICCWGATIKQSELKDDTKNIRLYYKKIKIEENRKKEKKHRHHGIISLTVSNNTIIHPLFILTI